MKTHYVLILTLCIVIPMVFGCCDDCSTCPDDKQARQEHYKMYVGAHNIESHAGYLLVMDIPTDSIIDSVKTSGVSEILTLTPDYKKIIMAGAGETIVYNTDSLTPDTTLPWVGEFHFDHQRYIGLVTTIDGLYKFSSNDFQVIDSVTRQFRYSQLDTTNGIIYLTGFNGEEASTIYRINYVSMVTVDSILIRDTLNNPIVVYEMLPVSEYNRLYFYGSVGSNSFSIIYDLLNEKVISQTSHSTPFGNFIRGTNGQTIYMSDPGREFTDIPGSYNIWIYNVHYDSLIGFYSTLLKDTLGYRYYDVQNMLLTPDGNYLYASGGGHAGLLKYNLNTGLAKNGFSSFYPLMPSKILIGGKIE